MFRFSFAFLAILFVASCQASTDTYSIYLSSTSSEYRIEDISGGTNFYFTVDTIGDDVDVYLIDDDIWTYSCYSSINCLAGVCAEEVSHYSSDTIRYGTSDTNYDDFDVSILIKLSGMCNTYDGLSTTVTLSIHYHDSWTFRNIVLITAGMFIVAMLILWAVYASRQRRLRRLRMQGLYPVAQQPQNPQTYPGEVGVTTNTQYPYAYGQNPPPTYETSPGQGENYIYNNSSYAYPSAQPYNHAPSYGAISSSNPPPYGYPSEPVSGQNAYPSYQQSSSSQAPSYPPVQHQPAAVVAAPSAQPTHSSQPPAAETHAPAPSSDPNEGL